MASTQARFARARLCIQLPPPPRATARTPRSSVRTPPMLHNYGIRRRVIAAPAQSRLARKGRRRLPNTRGPSISHTGCLHLASRSASRIAAGFAAPYKTRGTNGAAPGAGGARLGHGPQRRSCATQKGKRPSRRCAKQSLRQRSEGPARSGRRHDGLAGPLLLGVCGFCRVCGHNVHARCGPVSPSARCTCAHVREDANSCRAHAMRRAGAAPSCAAPDCRGAVAGLFGHGFRHFAPYTRAFAPAAPANRPKSAAPLPPRMVAPVSTQIFARWKRRYALWLPVWPEWGSRMAVCYYIHHSIFIIFIMLLYNPNILKSIILSLENKKYY